MSSIVGSLGIQPVMLIGQIVSFLVLYFAFKKFLFGPILANLDKRAKKQAEALKAAEETIRIKEEIAANETKMNQKLKAKIDAEFTKMQEEVRRQKEEMVKNAKEEAHRAAAKEYDSFAQKISAKEDEVRGHLSELVIQAAQKALSEHLDPKTGRTIVAQQIKKLKDIKL